MQVAAAGRASLARVPDDWTVALAGEGAFSSALAIHFDRCVVSSQSKVMMG